ncbi:carboxymuconolactone decarboxylase family protein [Streptomyces sp. CB01881]|uniref:carboxymuconolactone decarboxylase family protein n=1 Tax=Streptomyces sp. CB01881 TaxID=2078691 RepID=UPI000CDBBCCA|nr:carboxymuconolactone decarboxylase family protein [Streptomyces sp. CB01881]AUY51633.1 peroxidase [Streptomyces sp. CB01881]TYC71067.1 carboxymuconolactone decarboxylase family protein [Streptomyces sp. CB01881]
MPRLGTVNPDTAEPAAKALLDKVERALGVTPNMMRAMATSPAVLDGYLSFSGSLAKGTLGAALREQIALVTAVENSCDYCYAAHHVLGAKAGVSPADLASGGHAQAADPKAAAALRFARAVIRSKGFVSDEEIDIVRAAGYGDGEIGEIVGAVALNTFTNYFNSVGRTEIDFPVVALPESEVATA